MDIPAFPSPLQQSDDTVMSQDMLTLIVRSITQDTPDVRLYEFASPSGEPLPPFAAGAHVDLHLSNRLVRSYSIASDPADRSRYLIGVARDRSSRSGSVHIHDTLALGHTLRASPPRNNFPLTEGSHPTVLIAGGIGVTPMISMIQRLNALRMHWTMHFAARDRSAAPFQSQLAEHGGRVAFHFDEEQRGAVLDVEQIVSNAEADAHLYCCGPTPMIAAFKTATAGLSAERIHFEHFQGIEPGRSSGGFQVELARSGMTLEVKAGQTILDAVSEAGIAVPFSCQAGVCGSCETRVIDGLPDHHDLILTEGERSANKSMMICCSGARSKKLVLDL